MNLYLRKTHAVDGDPRGTVVFLHGFPFDGSMWSEQLDALPDGWQGIVPDLRGFGRTPLNDVCGEMSTGKRIGGRVARENEPVLTMACMADDVAGVIEREVDGAAVVCGLSMGGYVALELWRRHPERVRALVLADTRASADDDEGRENRMRTAQTVRAAGMEPVARAMIPALLAPGTRDGAPETVDRVRSMIVGADAPTVIAALAGMAARHDHTGELDRISVPTLVVTGEQDQLTPPETGRALAQGIPEATFTAIPDAGHLSPMENPTEFNRVLGEFLGGLQYSGGT